MTDLTAIGHMTRHESESQKGRRHHTIIIRSFYRLVLFKIYLKITSSLSFSWFLVRALAELLTSSGHLALKGPPLGPHKLHKMRNKFS